MTRIRQFAKDMSISYNDAKKLVDKGKKRKDGGSNILENYMPIYFEGMDKKKKKVPMPKPRPKNLKKKNLTSGSEFNVKKKNLTSGSEFNVKKKDPFRADKTESLDREFSKSVAKQNERNMKNVKKKRDGGIEYGDVPGGRAIRQRAGEQHGDIPGGRAKKKKKPESPKVIPAGSKGKGKAKFPDLSGDGKTTMKDVLIGRGVIKKSRGGGIAIQGTGFRGVR